MQVRSPGGEDPLEEGMAAHSSVLVWRIPGDRGAWRLQSIWSQRATDTAYATAALTLNVF